MRPSDRVQLCGESGAVRGQGPPPTPHRLWLHMSQERAFHSRTWLVLKTFLRRSSGAEDTGVSGPGLTGLKGASSCVSSSPLRGCRSHEAANTMEGWVNRGGTSRSSTPW